MIRRKLQKRTWSSCW